MRKSLIFVILICTALIVGYAVFSIIYLGIFETREFFTLPKKVVSSSEDDKFVLLGQHYSDEKVIGWMDDCILFGLYEGNLYKYYPSEGRREKIAFREELVSLSGIISWDKKNILIDHKFSDSSIIFDFMEEMHANEDYDFHIVDRENNSYFEIYDSSTKKREKLFDYTVKYRVDKKYCNSICNYSHVCISNNFKYLLSCIKTNKPEFTYTTYDINKKTTKSYEVAFSEISKDILQLLDEPSISNDGNTMWIIEILQSEKSPISRETTLYMLDFKQEKLKPQAIASNIGKYMVSLDNNYILHSTDTYFRDKSKLFCRNNKSKKEYLIEDNIVEDGFALSSSGNIAAYLVKDEIGAQLYIKDYSDEKSKSNLVYTFAEFLRVECIDFSSDGKRVFISYCTNEDAKSLAEYQMCLINLGDF